MIRYLHTFDMPVTGTFTSDHKDFEEALKQYLAGRKDLDAVKAMCDRCETYYSITNIEPTDQLPNPAEIE